jgi:ATP-dependent Clp protease adaptor protein ClpS
LDQDKRKDRPPSRACVVAVFAKDIAVTKSTRAAEAGRSKGYPLTYTTEPEE